MRRAYPGKHIAIIDTATFDAVQARLASAQRPTAAVRKVAGALLTGRVTDASGEVMSPAFSYGRGGRVYRYYVSTSLQQGRRKDDQTILRRISASVAEALVNETLARLLPLLPDAIAKLSNVQIYRSQLTLSLPMSIAKLAEPLLGTGEVLQRGRGEAATICVPIALAVRGGGAARVIAGAQNQTRVDPVLIASLRKAHAMLAQRHGQLWLATAPASQYDRRILRLAFLAPDIQSAILAGRQPAQLNLEAFMKAEMPLAWQAQRELFGNAAALSCYVPKNA